MKILFINSTNPYKGAGIFAKVFAKEMVKQGNQVRLITKDWGRFEDDFIVSYNSMIPKLVADFTKRIVRWPKICIKHFFPKFIQSYRARQTKEITNPIYDFMDFNHTKSTISSLRFIKRANFTPDVIFVFFAFNFLTEKDLYDIYLKYNKIPLFLCMPDTAILTGGCHQVFDCNGYSNGCGNCPALFSNDPNDQSRLNFIFKENYYKLMNITTVYGSLHQEQQLSKSLLFKDNPSVKIIGGVDTEICKSSKVICRQKYCFPQDKFILLFGAQSVSAYRKGLTYLIEALEMLRAEGIGTNEFHLALLGEYSQELDKKLNFSHTFLGFLPFDELPTVFATADIFLNPSIEDAGPMMINQSVMCGIPVVAFEMGVAKDIVITGKSGYLAELKNAADFANGIKSIYQMSDAQRKDLCNTTREIGLKYCSLDRQITALVNAFQIAIDKNNGR